MLIVFASLAAGAAAQMPTVILHESATAPERLAARELAHWLREMLGRDIETKEAGEAGAGAIIVGPGAHARRHFPELDLDKLRPEELVIKEKDGRLLLAGGRPRGTLYAVNRFLHRQGVRWWTPWATHVPKRKELRFKGLNVRESPTFEARDPFWYHAFDRDWARRNGSNSMHARLTDEDGGKIVYQGFVHTFFPLVPPDKHFAEHPEWYSLIDGKRRHEGAQLCTTNPELRDFVVARVREWLKENPSARIVSVSQNDWYGPCQCPNCKALDDAEGTHAATVLALANYVGEKIEKDHPDVAIDTLAYQYTRKAPKALRPRPNVIVRLCSIECNFAQPLTHPSNAAFARDLKDWSRLTNRLYVWNYVTDFPHYLLPFPNWYVVGPNQKFYAANGVKGLFEQGAYQSFGGAMAEMQAWVQAQLMWDVTQDDQALIREFLAGYYGPAAGSIQRYLDLLAREAAPHNMTIWTGPDAPFFTAKVVLEADRLWGQAESAVAGNPDLLWRVRQGRLPIRYVALSRWSGLRAQAAREKLAWTLPESRKAVADEWIALARGQGPAGWQPITHLSEAGLKPERWIERFAVDPEPFVLPDRPANTALPRDLVVPHGRAVLQAQDDEARLFGEGDLAELRPDPLASDGVACRMPGHHREWAFQLSVSKLPPEVLQGRWKVYAVVRVEGEGEGPGLTAGIWDNGRRVGLGDARLSVEEAGKGYRSLLLTTTALTSDCIVWVAPPASDAVKAVWVDRVLFVRE